MRKLLALIFCAALMLAFGACGADDDYEIAEYEAVYEVPPDRVDDGEEIAGQVLGQAQNQGHRNDGEEATPSGRVVLINGEVVAMRVFDVGGDDFVRLEDLSIALSGTQSQFDAWWWEHGSQLDITPGRFWAHDEEMAEPTTIAKHAVPTAIDMRFLNIRFVLPSYAIGDYFYFMLGDVARFLGFEVEVGADAVIIETNEPYVSEYGRQVAEDFLAQFLSIFSLGWGEDSGELVWHLDHAYWLSDDPFYFDIDGNPLTDEIFLRGFLSANSFRLYELDDSGIPAIMIFFGPPAMCGGFNVLYRYIDGRFVEMYPPIWRFTQVFRADDGRLVLVTNYEQSGYFVEFNFVEFDGIGMTVEMAASSELMGDSVGEFVMSSEFLTEPTIYGVGVPIVEIRPMIAMRYEIEANVRARLGLAE